MINMGAFRSIIEKELRKNFQGSDKGSDEWESFYGDHKIDGKINRMIDKVKDLVDGVGLFQLFIHEHECPVCRESIPKFKMIAKSLENRIDGYKSYMIELNEKLRVDGETVKGIDIYREFEKRGETKGVPFVVQNLKLEKSGSEMVLVPGFYVSYVGKIVPFRFLATTFNIENRYISEK